MYNSYIFTNDIILHIFKSTHLPELFFSPFVTRSLAQYLSFLRETKWILSKMQSKTEIKPDGGEKQAANPTLTTFKVLPKTYEAHENQIARRMMETLLGIRRLEDWWLHADRPLSYTLCTSRMHSPDTFVCWARLNTRHLGRPVLDGEVW